MADPINYHPHSRFTLHERANLYPFRDILWGRTDGPFIDLKVDYPDPANNYADGSAFLRCEDVVEMGHVLGMATREEVQRLKDEIASLRKQVAAIPSIVEGYKNELSGVTERFLANLASGRAGNSPVGMAPVSIPENQYKASGPVQPSLFEPEQGSDKGSDGDDSDSGESHESAPEPSAESPKRKGSDDVSGSGSDDPLADFLGLGGAG